MNAIAPLLSLLAVVSSQLPAQAPAAASPAASPADERRLTAALNLFAADLQQELARSGTTTCSPASVSLALLMLLPGARGDTEVAIRKVLHLPADLHGERLHAAARQVVGRCGGLPATCGFGDGVELRLVSDLWLQNGHEVGPEFAATLRNTFGGSVRDVDFRTAAEQARGEINRHIAAATRDRIPELLPPGAVTAQTRHVVTNALWFRGLWVADFYRPEKLEPFHLDAERTVDVAMMHVRDSFAYAETDAWQAVALPFNDGAVVFDLIVPRAGKALATAEQALLRLPLARAKEQSSVLVSMPAFRARVARGLRPALLALGLEPALTSGKADFGGVDTSSPLFLDDVLHATDIKVDEFGVEAAAATAGVFSGSARAPADPKIVNADRPFAYALRDVRNDLLLFVGRVEDPRSLSGARGTR